MLTGTAGMSQVPSFSQVCQFENLYAAHLAARKGKRDRREVIDFELDLGRNLVQLSRELEDGTYRMDPYVRFEVADPKRRLIHALRYRDRVVQHALCDNVVAPVLQPRLIYDNAACQRGKGTHFALDRLEGFLREHYRAHGAQGWFLKCDVRHFFASIQHDVMKVLLRRPPFDARTYAFLCQVIDSYADAPGRGLPLGNQTSQWFALYYLDGVDRLIKERLHVRAYVRYMDDMVLVHASKAHLRACLDAVRNACSALGLQLNGKTQIAPLRQGIDFLGWHLYLTDAGRVVRRLRQAAKRRLLRGAAAARALPAGQWRQVRASYQAHLAHGDTQGLRRLVG